MKKALLMSLIGGWVLCCAPTLTKAQEFTEHISKSFTVNKAGSGNVLAVYNIMGSIKVEGYTGDKVLIEVDKTISAKDNNNLEIGKKEFRLGFEQKGDSIIAYIAEPHDSRPHRSWKDGKDDKKIEYRYALEFTIKVPTNMSLCLSTVNKGGITVDGVSGSLYVRNVNGPITLNNVKGTTDVRTINGNVTANYLSTPPDASSYYTLNGELKVSYPANLSADLRLKSMRGAFYTDFTDTKLLPAVATRTQEKDAEGAIYKLNKNSDIRIGSGGKLFKFETMNGDIILKKQP